MQHIINGVAGQHWHITVLGTRASMRRAETYATGVNTCEARTNDLLDRFISLKGPSLRIRPVGASALPRQAG